MKHAHKTLLSLAIAGVSFCSAAEETSQTNDCCETQTQLETSKVSADFRSLDVQQIPSAVTVVNEQTILDRSADHLETVLSLAPNVNFASGSSRGRYFQIRGIGERSQFIDPVNPSVGLIIDGVDMTGLGGAATLFDIEQVEVLRGPQGTAFGANALAGAINIKSKQPTKETEGYVQGKIGNYNTFGLGSAISTSITDNAQARVAIHQLKSDGYMENVFLNRDDTNDFDELVARAQLSIQANDNNDINISLLKADIDNGYDAFSLDNTRTTYSDEPGNDTQLTQAGSISLTHKSLESADIFVQYAASDSDISYGYDEDWSYTGIHPDGYTSTDLYLRHYERQSLELRLTSKPSAKLFADSTSWVVGLYAQEKEETLDREYTWTGTFDSQLEQSSNAFYTELSSILSPTLSITYGVRAEQSSIQYTDSANVVGDLDETLWGGKITLDHMINPEHMAYASIARGYKAGGVNSDPDVSEENRTFDTEKNNTLELGLKSSTLGDSLQTRVSVFVTQRLDQQVKSSYSYQKPDNSFDFQDYLANAAEGRNSGLEIESNWQLTDNVNWKASVGYLKTEFIDYTYENSDGVQSKTGREQAHAPEWSYATSLDFKLGYGIRVVFESEGKEAFYFSDSHDETSESYVLYHAKAEYKVDNLTLSLDGRNLTDKDYATRGFGFGNDPRDGYSDTQHIQLGDPRLISLSARYAF